MEAASLPYPATLAVDYPARPLDRFSSFFRPIAIIPILIVVALISRPGMRTHHAHAACVAGGSLFAATMLMLLFRQKYPRWWFDWNLALARFGMRVGAYAALLRDEYPSTDEEQAVHLEIPYPDAQRELSRWLPIIKWILAVPHYVVLAFLTLAAVVAVVIAWFAILFTAQYPRALFDYVVGVLRWHLRVAAYAFLLTTDRYPPFRLSA